MPPSRPENSTATSTRRASWPEGFVEFYEDRYQPLVRVAALILRRRDVAEDVVQEVMVQMAARWDRIDHPVTYARTAVVNRSRTALRRHRREQPSEQADVEVGVADDSVPSELTAMWQAVGTLSPRRRAAVVLRFYEDLTDDEIADILDCRPATVRSLVHRALRQLGKELS